jgi:hypothetical protein
VRAIKKTVFTLNVDAYAPEITDITYPLIRHYARKIDADFHVISERKFPGWPVVYEKLQIHQLAREMQNDWNIYIDSDALVHPETVDWTALLSKDTVAHNGSDMASVRWKYDEYFLRDGRNIGSCNWFTVGSDWCLDLWRPLDDLDKTQALERIFPTPHELNTVITPEHLIDDYTLSRNIARFGLKFKTFRQILSEVGIPGASFFFHIYTETVAEKVRQMKEVLYGPARILEDGTRIEPWKLPKAILMP